VAMQSTQEGQQPAINGERVLPAFEKYHGMKADNPVLEFFAEHFIADADHSGRQIELVAKLVTNEDLRERALEVAETAVKTRWACMNEIYRIAVLGQTDPLPAAVAAEYQSSGDQRAGRRPVSPGRRSRRSCRDRCGTGANAMK